MEIKYKEIAEMLTIKDLLEKYPKGVISIVSDTFDLWKVVSKYLPQLKEQILARDGKLVIRPDSGDPVDILCGKDIQTIEAEDLEDFLETVENILHEELSENTPHGEYGGDIDDLFYWNNKLYDVTYSPNWNRYDKQYYFIDNYGGNKTTYKELENKPEFKGVIELLWDIFGGTINEQGYKVLDPHIGAIYGDSITTDRAWEICQRLEAKGFASTNVVFGIGSFTYQYNTRDTFGFAMKATYVERDGKGFEIFKDPVTDSGMKKSAKGLLKVIQGENGYELEDQITWEEFNAEDNELKLVYLEGAFYNEKTLTEIRNTISNGKN